MKFIKFLVVTAIVIGGGLFGASFTQRRTLAN